jgi:hypothetical protein
MIGTKMKHELKVKEYSETFETILKYGETIRPKV